MKELKTLKDFWTILPLEQHSFSNKVDVILHTFRAEAIKWIKEYRSIYNNMLSDKAKEYRFVLGKAEGLKEFFNMTEDELK